MLNYESDKFAVAFRAVHAAESSISVAAKTTSRTTMLLHVSLHLVFATMCISSHVVELYAFLTHAITLLACLITTHSSFFNSDAPFAFWYTHCGIITTFIAAIRIAISLFHHYFFDYLLIFFVWAHPIPFCGSFWHDFHVICLPSAPRGQAVDLCQSLSLFILLFVA